VAAIGAWLGVFPGLLVAVQIGALLGSAWGIGQWMVLGRRTVMPFGPALAGGALVWMLYGDVLVRWLLPGWSRWLG
jgi:prepilin signal peptidase PulO-like enzyme (type II secretory pathway)